MGDSSILDLGRLELRQAGTNLNLRLSSEAEFVRSAKNGDEDTPQLRELILRYLHGTGTQTLWVEKGHDYRLVIDLDLVGELKLEDEEFAQKVAVLLKQSKASTILAWSNLGLTVTSVETHATNLRSASWILSLEYREWKPSTSKAKLHKLSVDVPFYDTKPPPGIRTVALNSVHLRLSLTPIVEPPAKTSACGPTSNTGIRENANSGQEAFDPEMLFVMTDDFESGSTHWADNVEDCDNPRARCTSGISEQASSDTVQMQERSVSVGDVSAPSCAYLTPPSTQERLAHDLQKQPHGEDIYHIGHLTLDRLLPALETGLTHAIHKLPTRRSQSITITSNEGFICLSDVAPSLWMPGYYQSLSDRAVFLPTLNYALMRVAGQSRSSARLRSKVAEATRRKFVVGSGDSDCGFDNVDEEAVRTTLSQGLWHALATQLHDVAPKKLLLRPLSDDSKPYDNSNTLEEPEGMLDETATDPESCSPSESDFEDLLEAPNDVDEDSTYQWVEDDGLGSDMSDDLRSCWSVELGDTEDRVPGRWDLQQRVECHLESDLADDSLERCGNIPCGVQVSGDGRRSGVDLWNGSGPGHDSARLELSKVATAFCEDSEFVPSSPFEDIAMQTSSPQSRSTNAAHVPSQAEHGNGLNEISEAIEAETLDWRIDVPFNVDLH